MVSGGEWRMVTKISIGNDPQLPLDIFFFSKVIYLFKLKVCGLLFCEDGRRWDEEKVFSIFNEERKSKNDMYFS